MLPNIKNTNLYYTLYSTVFKSNRYTNAYSIILLSKGKRKCKFRGRIITLFDDDFSDCTVCGLADELCICQDVAMEESRIKVLLERRKWGKYYTLVTGLDPKEFELKKLAKQLRSKLACGGTVKGNIIELQGNHEYRIINMLVKMGFDSDGIDIIRK